MSDGQLTIVGYDARELWLDRSSGWGGTWKTVNLLRDDVDKPLSIDPTVWDSALELLGLEVPSYTGLFPGLWEDRARLEGVVHATSVAKHPICLAGFTLASHQHTAELVTRWRPIVERSRPNEVERTWVFLGYDVADGSATSALLTMRVPADQPLLRTRFGDSLNRAHLFDDPTRALDFAAYANEAISVHAPFFIYGVWSVWQTAHSRASN